jgi:AbiV family abortive infection protein
MGTTGFHQYRGKLTPAQVAEGMNAAINNARRLLEDAELLFSAGRYASACALAILSIEESGKLPVLRRLALAQDDAQLKKAWKGYRDHRTKNVAWILPDLIKRGAKKLNDLRKLFDPDSDHPQLLDEMKQLTFYTDCFNKVKWSEPGEFGSKELIERILQSAKLVLPKRVITTREMELWIDSMTRNERYPSRDGLLAFYAAMKAEGLSNVGTSEIEEFTMNLI